MAKAKKEKIRPSTRPAVDKGALDFDLAAAFSKPGETDTSQYTDYDALEKELDAEREANQASTAQNAED